MKITTLLLVLLLFNWSLINAQEIIYDFNTNDFGFCLHKNGCTSYVKGLPENFKEGEQYKIKVKNINRFLYDVSINSKAQSYVSNPTAIIGPVFGSLTQLNAELATDLTTVNQANKDALNNCIKYVRDIDILLLDLAKKDDAIQKKLRMIYKSVISEEDVGNINNSNNLLKSAFDLITKVDGLVKQVSLNDNECFLKVLAQYESLGYHEKLNKYAKIITNLSEDAFQYESPPIIVERDFATFSINITPKNLKDVEVTVMPLRKDSISVKIPVFSRRAKLSFSTGFFVDGIQNGDSYLYKPIAKNDSVNVYQLVKENNKNKRNIGVSSLAHLMWPLSSTYKSSPVKAGFLIGLGLPFKQSPNIRIMLGGSVAIGKKEQLLLSVGYAGTTVKEPSSTIDADILDGKFLFKDTSFQIPYINKVDGGFFLSATFNVFELK